MKRGIVPLVIIARLSAATLSPAQGTPLPHASDDKNDIVIHEVESPHQAGKTQVKVLLPEELNRSHLYAVIYILPVEARNENRYGDGLLEIKKQGLHNKHAVIFVAPTFSHLPWYCDHPTNPAIHQETHFVEFVVPFIERKYPVAKEPNGRLLLGFSKSGWGAWDLLLRHPDTFGRAVAWDAPLMMSHVGMYGTTEIFGTQANFERYRISDLLRTRADVLKSGKRLNLTGYGNFREHHRQIHSLLDQLQVPHEYCDGPPRSHDWHSGWVAEAVQLLLGEKS